MAVSSDIAAMYRRPRAVIRARLALPRHEPRLLAWLLAGCLLLFVAQAPAQARAAHLDPEIPQAARLYWSFLFFAFLLPFIAYAAAAFGRIVAALLGGRGSWYSARLVLFWALLASVPAWLLAGLVAGFIGPGPAQTLTGGLALGVFVVFWGLGLSETERAGVTA